ncbi:MAG: L-2-amino-thiazoline-4-carboxylic acid hydrolase [Eggerthellaceae bacterium]|nr:L-2-amino-thiazoline-4-carboxylic acid hydrolase [Eggerthellaceae bacterium]MBQ9044213.1 L-2-amino-thiazoline-4-carboxylic acid hydrolase [Eggerthellaceae bacterium]
MAKRVRYLAQVVPHLEEHYGATKTQAIMQKALARYDELLEENADEPKACHMHTWERIYPAIAVFDAMTAEGIDRTETTDFLVDYYTWRAGGMASKVKALFKIPGLYKIVPKFFLNMTEKSFGPQAGFASENKYLAKDEMSFDMIRCPYMDACARYGCPEIVRGFCDADDVCYGDIHPRISWERTKTLGYGYDRCDFKVRIR